MKIKKTILISLLFAFLFIPFVSASSVEHTSVGYGYNYYDVNNTLHTVNWVSYNTNNLTKYNYDLPATYNGEGINIIDFGLRFHITNNFSAGTSYTINFTWMNSDPALGVFAVDYSHLVYTLHCRLTSWNSTGYDESYCFNSTNISYQRGSTDSEVNVSFTFTPKVDFYGTTIYYYHDNDPYTSFSSDGWEISNISYSETTDNSQAIINNQNQNTQNIINNQNQNAQSIINNQNTNNQSIINNQNQNTQNIINNQNQNAQDIQNTINDNFQSCRDSYNLLKITSVSPYVFSNGVPTQQTSNLVIDSFSNNSMTYHSTQSGYYTALTTSLNLKPNTQYTISFSKSSTATNNQFFIWNYDNGTYTINYRDNNTNVDKKTFTTNALGQIVLGFGFGNSTGTATISDIMLNEGSTALPYEPFGEQVCSNKIDDTNNAINGVNDSINNSNVSDSTSDASNFFSGFTTETYGLTGVITAPLNVIQSITSKTCSPLVLPLPFVNQNLTLPCMGEIYSQYFGSFLTIYQTITFGVVAYWVVVRIFNLVKDFKNPDHDEIEVLDL